ncbi:hypothetical protein S245_067460 [Arachis hypogaea]
MTRGRLKRVESGRVAKTPAAVPRCDVRLEETNLPVSVEGDAGRDRMMALRRAPAADEEDAADWRRSEGMEEPLAAPGCDGCNAETALVSDEGDAGRARLTEQGRLSAISQGGATGCQGFEQAQIVGVDIGGETSESHEGRERIVEGRLHEGGLVVPLGADRGEEADEQGLVQLDEVSGEGLDLEQAEDEPLRGRKIA